MPFRLFENRPERSRRCTVAKMREPPIAEIPAAAPFPRTTQPHPAVYGDPRVIPPQGPPKDPRADHPSSVAGRPACAVYPRHLALCPRRSERWPALSRNLARPDTKPTKPDKSKWPDPTANSFRDMRLRSHADLAVANRLNALPPVWPRRAPSHRIPAIPTLAPDPCVAARDSAPAPQLSPAILERPTHRTLAVLLRPQCSFAKPQDSTAVLPSPALPPPKPAPHSAPPAAPASPLPPSSAAPADSQSCRPRPTKKSPPPYPRPAGARQCESHRPPRFPSPHTPPKSHIPNAECAGFSIVSRCCKSERSPAPDPSPPWKHRREISCAPRRWTPFPCSAFPIARSTATPHPDAPGS